jgi:hypothetical protein
MQALTAQQLLTVWESGQFEMPTGRAMALLSAAFPAVSAESLTELSIGQRDAQLLRLREWTFGPHLLAVSDCPQCGERVELTFTVDDIRPPAEIEQTEPLSLAVEDYEISFRLPNSADLMAVADGGDVNAIRNVLAERCVLQVRFQGADAASSDLPENVISAISGRMAATDPQADIQLALECPGCGHEWKAMFDIVSFFWREISVCVRRLLSEIHVLASAYGWREADILAMSQWRRNFYLEMLGA